MPVRVCEVCVALGCFSVILYRFYRQSFIFNLAYRMTLLEVKIFYSLRINFMNIGYTYISSDLFSPNGT